MDKNKEKKKTLTISSNFKKKIAPNFLSKKDGKKSYSISGDKKNVFKSSKTFKKTSNSEQNFKNQEYCFL